MLINWGYLNPSLIDTFTGEYWRSFHKKRDYFHVYDYFRWNENEVERILDGYGWERAKDTKVTWCIGDGTMGFYNYIYYTVAGFSEHDAFRCNQIREGQLTCKEAFRLLAEENKPRYDAIKRYLDRVGVDFEQAITVINNMPKLYKE